jgi:hypothetical protein
MNLVAELETRRWPLQTGCQQDSKACVVFCAAEINNKIVMWLHCDDVEISKLLPLAPPAR